MMNFNCGRFVAFLFIMCCYGIPYGSINSEKSVKAVDQNKQSLKLEFPLLYDVNYSPYVGASLIESTYSAYSFLWPHSGFTPYFTKNNIVAGLERLAHIFVDYSYAAKILTIVNHEVMGHGFRL